MATLLIETAAGEQIEIEIDDPRLDALPLSDSRAQMPDLTEIAKALSLDEDADEAKILDALKARPEIDPAKIGAALGIEDADEKAILDAIKDREPEGKELLDADEIKDLREKADAGVRAEAELKAMRFNAEFDQALKDGRIDARDETRERFQKLYDVDADTTIATLQALPKVVSTEPKGSGEGRGEAPDNVDADRFDVHQAAMKRAAEDKIDYELAVSRVLADRSAA